MLSCCFLKKIIIKTHLTWEDTALQFAILMLFIDICVRQLCRIYWGLNAKNRPQAQICHNSAQIHFWDKCVNNLQASWSLGPEVLPKEGIPSLEDVFVISSCLLPPYLNVLIFFSYSFPFVFQVALLHNNNHWYFHFSKSFLKNDWTCLISAQTFSKE